MNRVWLALVLVVAAGLASVAGAAPPATQPKDDATGLVMHEWGTFTSFAGSNGINLEFRPLVSSDLPAFVLDRPRQARLFDERLNLARSQSEFGKLSISAYMRMETPVIYFYTDRQRTVDVTVVFPKGLLTEFYPPVRQMAPDFKPDKAETVGNSWLRWGKVMLLPPGSKDLAAAQLPAVEGDNHYAHARETDSAIIRLTDMQTGKAHYEKFLFYRGVGNFELPIKLESLGTDQFRVTSDGKAEVPWAFVVSISAGRVRFAAVGAVGREANVTLPREAQSVDALGEAVVRALVAQGLYEKEALSMVKTWRSSWFGEEGTRLLYGVPTAQTDALLPLQLDPKPQSIVRVLVGRIETMTPETEGRVAKLVMQLGADAYPDREAASVELRRLGRFAEPALRRAAEVSQDPEVKARALALLKRGIN